MGPSNKNNAKNIPTNTGSPMKKANRKTIGKVLPYSPRMKVTKVNKVFVVGTQFGIILIRTEKQDSTDDAFTNNVIKMIEEEQSDVATELKIMKICSRRISQKLDKAIMQSSNYPSQWFVSITDEVNNTLDYRRELVDNFINFLNKTEWKYPQQFAFADDETKSLTGNLPGSTLDMYLLNHDIACILKNYIFEDFEEFLQDEVAISLVFHSNPTALEARNMLVSSWFNGN
jgi:hypothetical protein